MRRLLVSVVAFLVVVGSAQAAPQTLHLKFSRVGTAVGVMTDGRYTLIVGPRGAGLTLLDEATRKRVKLPACAAPHLFGALVSGFEGPYFEWRDCAAPSSTLDLYTLATGTIIKLPMAEVPSCQDPEGTCTESAGPAGTDWYVVFEFFPACDCSGATIVNRQTGQEAGPAGLVSGPIDLNSPNAARATCPPLDQSPDVLSLVFGGDSGYTGAGLTPDLHFQDSFAPLGGFAVDPIDHHLFRCRSTLDRRLNGGEFTGNRSALLVWNFGDTELRGLFLPSLHRFIVPLPKPLRPHPIRGTTNEFFAAFTLSNHRLWAVTRNGQLWMAPAPLQH